MASSFVKPQSENASDLAGALSKPIETWPTRLRMLRHRVRPSLSQAKVANHLGIAPASVAQWELGRSRPDIDKLPKLARLYSVSLEDLCGGVPASEVDAICAALQNPDQVPQAIHDQLVLLSRAWSLITRQERLHMLRFILDLIAARSSAP